MRILFITGNFPARSETFITRQINGVRNLGISAQLLATAGQADAAMDFHLPVRYTRSVRKSSSGRMVQALQVFFQHVWKKPKVASVFVVGLLDRASRYITYLVLAEGLWKARDYDLIHVQFGGLGRVVLRLKALGVVNCPVVVAFRGQDSTQLLRKHPGIYREVYRAGDAFLPVSRELLELHLAEGCPEEKLHLHRSCLPLAQFQFQPKKIQSPVRLLAVGRFVAKKGFDILLQSLSVLQEAGISYTLKLVGEGEEQAAYEGRVREMKLSGITFTGWLQEEALKQAYQWAHLVVVPSITDREGNREGIPNVIKEAMASGTPVVASRHGGIPELVIDQKTGFLFEEGDATSLGQILFRLAQEGVPDQLLEAARARVTREYDCQVTSRELLALYGRLLSADNS